MEASLKKDYQQSFWESYSRAISLISVLSLVIAFVIGSYDLLKLIRPEFTLSSNLQEKYKTNESYTGFGAFKKNLSEKEIARERTLNYEKLLRMERRNAQQRLVKVGFTLLIITILNGIFVLTFRWSKRRA